MRITTILNIIILLFSKNALSCIIIGTDRLEQNLCEKKVCPNYGKCKIDNENSQLSFTKCVCSNECDISDTSSMLLPDYLKSNGMTLLSINEPVCGSDGKNYANACNLRFSSCEQRTDIRIMHIGKCDPCHDFGTCVYPQVCRLDKYRMPVCLCGYVCSLEFKPVCGNDGKTYLNECHVKLEACRMNRDIEVTYLYMHALLIN